MQSTVNSIDNLAFSPSLNDLALLSQLKAESPEYLVKADDVSADTTPLEWWERQEHSLPRWTVGL